MSQELDREVLDLCKLQGFYSSEHMWDFEKFSEILPFKNKFYSSLSGKGISGKGYRHVFKVSDKFEMNMIKDCT